MSTITKEFTKEQLIEQAKKNIEVLRGAVEKIPGASDAAVIHLKLAEITLASLEADAVAYVDPFAFHNFSVYRAGETDNKRMGREWMWANPDAGLIPVYTAPPAPVSVPVAGPVAFINGAREPVLYGAHIGIEIGTNLYAAPPAPTFLPDEQHSERFDWTLGQWAEHVGGHYQGNDPANYYEFGSFMAVASMLSQFGTVQQKLGWNACRAAMLQGAENAESTTTIQTAPDLDSLPKIAESPSGNSPVIPDGWKLVPVEPTMSQELAGYRTLTDTGKMSRLMKTRLSNIYRAMIAAAPQQEVNNG